MNKAPIKFAFFGSSRFSVIVLDELVRLGFRPNLIVTTPDKPRGRKLALTPNVVKTWAIDHGIPVLDPLKLDDSFIENLLKIENCKIENYTFVVASYGKIIPQDVIDLPPHKTLNIHPSLLPKYRGATPLQTAMLDDAKKTGVTIMSIDKEMDHGPIVAARAVSVSEWPTYEDFEEIMAKEGAALLAETLPGWIAGSVKATGQDHSKATYTKKISTEDALIDISDLASKTHDEQYALFRKIQAFHQSPRAYFFIKKSGAKKSGADGSSKKLRVKITSASFKNSSLSLERVIPEGSREMSYSDFQKGYITK